MLRQDDQEREAQFLSQVIDRVGRRDHIVHFFSFRFEMPPNGSFSVPLRFKASADELPDDESEPTVELLARIERRPRA